MSRTHTCIIFEALEKEAKACFNDLESRFELALYRILPARWAVFVKADSSEVEWDELRRLGVQVSEIVGATLFEFYNSNSGVHHELYRGGSLAYASKTGRHRLSGLEPTGEELLGAIPLRKHPRTIEVVHDILLWNEAAERIAWSAHGDRASQ